MTCKITERSASHDKQKRPDSVLRPALCCRIGAAWRGTDRILNGWIEADVFNIILIALALAIAAESAYTGIRLYKAVQADGERDVDVFADRLLSVDRIVIAAAFLLAAACCVPDIVEHGLRSSYTVLAVLAIALGAIFFLRRGQSAEQQRGT